jgi:hypothetical protein
MFIAGVVVVALFALLIHACFKDARSRGKSGILVTLCVLAFFPFGLIAWLLFRPEPLRRSSFRSAILSRAHGEHIQKRLSDY